MPFEGLNLLFEFALVLFLFPLPFEYFLLQWLLL